MPQYTAAHPGIDMAIYDWLGKKARAAASPAGIDSEFVESG
ncbi:hypothetical protein [Microcoleus sp. B4-D4]